MIRTMLITDRVQRDRTSMWPIWFLAHASIENYVRVVLLLLLLLLLLRHGA